MRELQQTERKPDGDADEDRGEAEEDGDLGAVDDSRQHVAAELVGAEQMAVGEHRQEFGGGIDASWVIERQQPTEDGHEQHDQQPHDGDPEQDPEFGLVGGGRRDDDRASHRGASDR